MNLTVFRFGTAVRGKNVDDYSISDIAHWAWVRLHHWARVQEDDLSNLQRWMDVMAAKLVCQKGIIVPEPFEPVVAFSDAKKIIK